MTPAMDEIELNSYALLLLLEKENHEDEYAKFPPIDFSLADAVKTDVRYRLLAKSLPPEGILLDEDVVAQAEFNRDLPTKILMHGWKSNETSYWYQPLHDAYFQRGEYNVIFIDWSEAGAKDYRVSAANVVVVGDFIAEFLLKSNIPLGNIHIIGHSLGAHLAGYVGKAVFSRTSNKIARITATDPAGPGWENKVITEEQRLCPSDAQFVDVIHTDIGHYGFLKPLGHADFYPNGGFRQPGYSKHKEDVNYSHARSNYFFIESVNTKMKALSSKSWEQFTTKNYGEPILFGEDAPKDARGVFFFRTNSEPPFAIELQENCKDIPQ